MPGSKSGKKGAAVSSVANQAGLENQVGSENFELGEGSGASSRIPKERAEIISTYRVHATDSGSPEVQVALLTSRLNQLSTHFAKHSQDIHSKRGMYRMISQRKKLLHYLKHESPERYKNVISSLGLRK